MKSFLAPALILTGLAGGSQEPNETRPRDMRSTDMPRPRDGDVAIRQELEAAGRSGTLAAYDIFLARHPDHPLAAAASREMQRLTAKSAQ